MDFSYARIAPGEVLSGPSAFLDSEIKKKERKKSRAVGYKNKKMGGYGLKVKIGFYQRGKYDQTNN